MSEEFRINRSLRYGATVHRYIRTVLAQAEGVYHLRKNLLPGSAFTCYKYREVCGGHLNSYVKSPVQSLMIANYSKPLFYAL